MRLIFGVFLIYDLFLPSFRSWALPVVVFKVLQNHRSSPGSLYMEETPCKRDYTWTSDSEDIFFFHHIQIEQLLWRSTWTGRKTKHCLWLELSSGQLKKSFCPSFSYGKRIPTKRRMGRWSCGIWLPLLRDTCYHQCWFWCSWVYLVFSFCILASRRNQRLSLGCCGSSTSQAPFGRLKLSEAQGTKDFKSTRCCRCRGVRKTSCYSSLMLLGDLSSQGHKQTFCRVKSRGIIWDHFPSSNWGAYEHFVSTTWTSPSQKIVNSESQDISQFTFPVQSIRHFKFLEGEALF